MKPEKHFFASALIFVAAACLIALTWVGTTQAIDAQRQENTRRVEATLSNQALTVSEQINRQILALDQTLRFIVAIWTKDPRHFDLEAWRSQAAALTGLSRDMILTDDNGIIRQSSVAEAINQNASGLDFYRALSAQSGVVDSTTGTAAAATYIGPATIDGLMRQWHMNVARPLHYPDGSFAGAIDTDYRIASITDIFSQTDLGPGAFAALVGLDDGKLRGVVGPSSVDPDASIAETPMFTALAAKDSGIWTGPSANDAVVRIHAFRHIPGRRLAIVVGMDESEAMRPARVWREQAQIFASCITALLIGLTAVLIRGKTLARRRDIAMAQDGAMLASSNAQIEVARALASAKTEQLEATLAGMTDGVSMFDAHLCLVEWNARFPEIAGVPPELLRVGLPMEEVLRAQILSGQFGSVQDQDTEINRRIVRLRAAPFGIVQRQRPDGRTLELRRNRLPDGGFVTLYADVTEHKVAEAALRRAQAESEATNAEKSRFVAIVSHEIRTPLNALLNTIRLLADSVLAPAQRSLLSVARQSGDVLFSLVNDILDMSQMEAGKLAVRPSLFELRPLLESCVEMFATQASDRGTIIEIMIADGTPDVLIADPGRLRQIQLNLLSNALKYADPGTIWLTAEPGHDDNHAVVISIRDSGPVINSDARAGLFQPFSRLERSDKDNQPGTGLGLSICQHLVTLMGGTIGCDVWRDPSGRAGNVFWLTLPATALPLETEDVPNPIAPKVAGGIGITDRRSFPRTRILLADDIAANQLVTSTLLRRAGHHVDIVGTGEAAIQALCSAPYDLVFMDIFMPGMSGQEATQIIRTMPDPARSVPIIALTAMVGPEDAVRFKSLGMDGVVAKPVALDALLDVIRTHVWATDDTADNLEPANSTYQDIPRLGSPAVLSKARIMELRTHLPPNKFSDLVEECLVDMEQRVPELRRALTAGTRDSITAHAHALVGMAGGYGMAALEARLRTIMVAAHNDDLSVLGPAIIREIDSDFAEAAHQLREITRREIA